MGKHRLLKLLGAAAVSAASIYAINLYIHQKAVEKHILKASEEDFTDWNGLRVYCKRRGSGSPVVMLHHLNPACSAEDWASVMPQLTADHSVFALDLPGCGRSDKPETTFTNFYYVQFLLDFIKNTVGQKAYVIAEGDACPIALMAAVYDSSKISGLSLLSPPALAETASVPTKRTRQIKFLLSLPLVGRLIYQFLYSRDAIDDLLCEKMFYNPFLVDEEMISQYHESAHLQSEGGRFLAASLLGNYVNISLAHALSKLSVPTQLLCGTPTEESVPVHGWAEAQPAIRLRGIEKSSLLMQVEQSEAVAEALLEALDAVG